MNFLLPQPLVAFGSPSGGDMMILAIVVLVLFGSKKLPLFGRSLGRSLGEFRKTPEELEQERRDAAGLNRRPPKEGDPHAQVNAVMHGVFVLSLLLLIFSIVLQLKH